MRDPAELLAMLATKGPRIGHIPGGISRLTPNDIAAALGISHVPPPQTMLILAKYALDKSARHRLFAYWFDDRLAIARREGWRLDVPKRVEALCVYTISETLNPHTCRRCEGAGQLLVDVMRSCKTCGGSGRRYWGDRRVADLLAVGLADYQRDWRPRVSEARRRLMEWEVEGLDGLRRGMGIRRGTS